MIVVIQKMYLMLNILNSKGHIETPWKLLASGRMMCIYVILA